MKTQIKLLKYSLSIFFSLAMTNVVFAQDTSNLIGTWKGTSNTSVIGADQHHDNKANNNVQFFNSDFTIVIDKVQGRNFSGYLESKNRKELVAGAIRSNMKSGVFVDSDGMATFELVEQDIIELCYTHTTSSNNKSSVAACTDYKRQ
jgi:hypothetical protein